MSLSVSGLPNSALPPTFIEPARETDDEFAVTDSSSLLLNETHTQESLDNLVLLISDVVERFIAKVKVSTYSTTKEPEGLAAELKEILGKIFAYTIELKKIEEAQGALPFWRSKLGLGGDHPSQIKLRTLDTALKANWRDYLKRCADVAEGHFVEGQQQVALKVYRRLETIAPYNALILERLGDLYSHAGQHDKAIGYFDRLISRKVRPQSAALKKAHCLLEAGKTKEAFDILHTLSQKSHEIVAIKKEVILKGIESKIRLGKYLDAISDSHLAIQTYPEADEFRRILIDAYLAYSVRDEGKLFLAHFAKLADFFSKQRCYSPIRRSLGDSLQILLDLFDYSAKKSPFAFILYQGCISSYEGSDEFFGICYDNLLERLEFLETKIKDIKAEAACLREKIVKHTFEDEDETHCLRNQLVGLPEELLGGRRGQVRIGLLEYNKFYHAVILRLKEKAGKLEWKQKVKLLEVRSKQIKSVLIALTQEFIKAEGADVGIEQTGLRALFATKEQLAKRARGVKEEDDEVSSVDLIKRGNLMNFICATFVPKEERDELVKYLGDHGIDLEVLFKSDLMDKASGKQVESPDKMKELKNCIERNTIKTIEDLKRYITK